MILLLSCAAPEVWPQAEAACADFSADCQAVLSAHFGIAESVSGLPKIALLEGLWELARLELGPACPDWAPAGGSGAACLYNESAASVVQSVYADDAGFLTVADDTLTVGPDMGYYSALRVSVGLAEGIAGACGAAWLGEAGLAGCEGDDCFIFLEASSADCP